MCKPDLPSLTEMGHSLYHFLAQALSPFALTTRLRRRPQQGYVAGQDDHLYWWWHRMVCIHHFEHHRHRTTCNHNVLAYLLQSLAFHFFWPNPRQIREESFDSYFCSEIHLDFNFDLVVQYEWAFDFNFILIMRIFISLWFPCSKIKMLVLIWSLSVDICQF